MLKINKYIQYVFFSLLISLFFIKCEPSGEFSNIEEDVTITPLTESWEKAIPNQEVPEGLTSLSAEHCGGCHQQHYNEWRMSTHSHAWTDLQFQAELKKESSPFMCINCHIPLQNQQEYIIEGLMDGDIYRPVKVKNPEFDYSLQQEGINCASCHVRNGTVLGPTGTSKAPHKTVKDIAFLSESLCISCHNAVAVITPTLACSFETGDEWQVGPFKNSKNCIDCHMEATHREVVLGYGERTSRFHTFPGSGIPKFDSVETNILNGLAFYSSTLKAKYSIEEEIHHTLKVKNEFAGHKVPTGDPERFFLVEYNLLNEIGDTVSKMEARIGEHWEWYPEVKKISDNNLNPGEEREFIFREKLKTPGSYLLSLIVTKHRLNKESAMYNKLGDDYPLEITVFKEDYRINVFN